MEYEVIGAQGAIDFGPKTEVAEVLQNIRTILTTIKYSVPLDREFGLSATMLDEPIPKAQAALSAEIVSAIQKFEPRAKVTFVSFVESDHYDGILIPKVKVRIRADIA